jgi:hypothetical protein
MSCSTRSHLMLLLLILAFGSMGRSGATTIVDVQKSGTDGVSPLANQIVTVEGVVTASAEGDNLDAVFIQQPGPTEWAGIQLTGFGLFLLEVGLKIGDLVRVTGTVEESSGMTLLRIDTVDDIMILGKGTVDPLVLDPNIFIKWGWDTTEPYESMLIELRNPDGGDVFVVAVNADGPLNNFGEWRIGSNIADTAMGCRILTGRQSSNITSSLNVSYINNEQWASNSGRLNVPPIVVQDGDRFPLVRGIMINHFGHMKLLPRNNADFVPIVPDSRDPNANPGERRNKLQTLINQLLLD